jgi:GDP-L-fucose synthase
VEKSSKIYIAGHRGMVGSAIHRKLVKEGFDNFVLKTSSQLDLRNQADVRSFFEAEKPEYIFLAAAKVGGIMANNIYRAEFLHDNLLIQNNVIDSAYRSGAEKLMFLGSSCIYPQAGPTAIKRRIPVNRAFGTDQ